MLEEQKKIAESTTFYFLYRYSSFFLGIIINALITRLIGTEDWAFLLLALSFVNFAVFICNFFPPAGNSSLGYYIPHLLSNKDEKDDISGISGEIRCFIIHVYKIRLISFIGIYILFILIVWCSNLDPKIFEIILIVSPLILFNMINELNFSVFSAFLKFKRIYITNIIFPVVQVICVSVIFIFQFQNVIILISYVYLGATILSSILSISLMIPLIPRKKQINLQLITSYKKNFLKIHKEYGLNIVFTGIFAQISMLIVNLMYLSFDVVMFITYIMICQNAVMIALNFSTTDESIFYSIFSKINYEKNPEKFMAVFYQLNKYLMLFLSFSIALIFYFVDIYIFVIYSEKYLNILFGIQIFLFIAFSKYLMRTLSIIPLSTNKTKLYFILNFCQMMVSIISAFIALLFKDFLILIIFDVLVAFLISLLLIYLINMKFKKKMKVKIIFKPFLIFLISFLIATFFTLFIDIPFFNEIYLLNRIINDTFKFIIFLLIYYFILYNSKFITKQEFQQLIEIIPLLNSKNVIFRKFIKITEKFFPSKSN